MDTVRTRHVRSSLVAAFAALTVGGTALAQTEGATAEAPAAPPPVELAPAAPAPAPALEAPAAEVAAPAPAAEDPTKLPIKTSLWGRIGNVVQGTSDAEKLNDMSQNAEVNVLFNGRIHKNVGWTANFVGTFGPRPEKDALGARTGKVVGDPTGSAGILDLIGQLDLTESFNIWVGRMLVPSDRSNFSGAWFMAPWNYPGQYAAFAAPVGPRQGPSGRNDGATLWGAFAGGMFKYYVGAFDLFDPSQSPLITGRVNVALLGAEPGYYASSTFYGKDMLSVGLSAQYKRDGSVAATTTDDFTGFSADVLYEKNLGDAGVLDAEGAFHLFNGKGEAVENHFFALASYLLPTEIGIGRLQPLVRFQGASPKGGGDMYQLIDAQVGYVISQYAARLALGYTRSDVAGGKGNAVFLGFQLQK
jgi:hypothetical protein